MLIRLTKANFRFTFNGLIITGEENTVFSSEGQEQIYHQIIEDQKLRELIEKYIKQDTILYNGMIDDDLKKELQKLVEESKK